MTSCTTFPRGDVVTPAPVPWSTYCTRDVVASKAGIVVVAPDPAAEAAVPERSAADTAAA
ncbi:hypothetical protein [Methylobacterium oryzae]|uniref:hypothetical protein n=1 Tax=Methylobacterium oryzae TaxID=334852 RepID=UPI002F360BEC